MQTALCIQRCYTVDNRLFKWTPPDQHWHIGKLLYNNGTRNLMQMTIVKFDSDGIELGSNVPEWYRDWLRSTRAASR